ncbi:Hypothetical protein CINCED_3A004240 [Cinara cedri]|uniref:Uncharacterized protein n=1 Tax=Cinara cedri TaxID=506608 RepID=A0A5E4M8H5_9HEMI|nr:Hypothetical protein CINCED_3A004240 [Cinara cedri]
MLDVFGRNIAPSDVQNMLCGLEHFSFQDSDWASHDQIKATFCGSQSFYSMIEDI